MIPTLTDAQADLLWRVFVRDGDGFLSAEVAASKLGRDRVTTAQVEGRLRRLERRALVTSESLTRRFEGREEPVTERVFSVTASGREAYRAHADRRDSRPPAEGPTASLFTAGHPAWEALNVEKDALRRAALGTPVAELLRRGQALSAQAAALRRAVERG